MKYRTSKNKLQEEMTADPSKYPQKKFKDKPCRKCGSVFKPKAPSHMYCSQKCADVGITDAYLMRTYSITYSDYTTLLDQQGHVCAICKTEGWTMAEHHTLKLVVDHCHASGKVRGLLCHNCNRGLGLFKDNVEWLNAASLYLEGATTIRKE